MSATVANSPSELFRANRACEAFEAAWRGGRRPRVEDFCGDGPPDPALAAELIGLDADYRRLAGEEPTPADYADRFPGLGHARLAAVLGAAGPPAGLEAGGQLGRFTLLERVGSGACGAVWRAFDTALNRAVALKVPHPTLAASPEAAERFRREARVAARLRHPGVVAVHEVADIDGLPVLVQEFVPGESLRAVLARHRPGPREAAALAAELAEALDYAHRAGAVHRDIKPANVMVPDPPAGPVIVDFGLATDGPAGHLTADGQLLGTPAYMSPEQARGDAAAADVRSDVYSLGVVLYEMLCGGPPFAGAREALLRSVIADEPRPPRRADPRVPRDLETVCLKAMAKEPRRRYATAGEFAADLRRFLAGEPVRARPVGPAARAARWARRNPAAAALLAVTALAAAGGAWYGSRLDAVNADLRSSIDRETAAAAAARLQADTIREQSGLGRRAVFALRLAEVPALWRRDPLRLRELLRDPAACPPELRDFTWRHFDRLCDLGEGEWSAGPAATTALALSADGRRLFAGSADGSVRAWDLDAGGPPALGDAHAGAVTAACVLPDGRFATAGADGTVRVRDPATAAAAFALTGHDGPVRALAWEASSGRLASAGRDGTVRLWDVAARGQAARWAAGVGPVVALAAHPTAARLAVAGGGKLGVTTLDAATGRRLASWPETVGPAVSLAFSPDGALLAQGCQNRAALVRDAATGRVVHRCGGHWLAIDAVQFSPDGRLLACAGVDGNLRLWDTRTWEQWTNILRHRIACLAFGPGGRVATGSDGVGGVSLWRLPPYPDPVRFPLAERATAVAERGGSVAASTLAGEVRVWPAGGGDPAVVRPPGPPREVRALAWSPDGRTLAFGTEGKNQVWLWADGGPPAELAGHGSAVLAAAYHPAGRLLATGSRDKTIRVWDLAARKPVAVLRGHTDSVKALAFSADGSRLVSAGDEGAVRLWDAAAWKPLGVLSRHDDWALTVAIDPAGRLVASGGRDRVVKVWDLIEGRERYAVAGYTSWVYAVQFAPDGRTLATATGVPWIGAHDGEVKFLDPETGYVRAVLEGVGFPLAFAGDGRSLLVGCRGGVKELPAGR